MHKLHHNVLYICRMGSKDSTIVEFRVQICFTAKYYYVRFWDSATRVWYHTYQFSDLFISESSRIPFHILSKSVMRRFIGVTHYLKPKDSKCRLSLAYHYYHTI